MYLQQGLKVKRRAREGGLIMGGLVELEKAEAAALGSASRNAPVSPSLCGTAAVDGQARAARMASAVGVSPRRVSGFQPARPMNLNSCGCVTSHGPQSTSRASAPRWLRRGRNDISLEPLAAMNEQ